MQDRANRVMIQFAPEIEFEVEPLRVGLEDGDLPELFYRELPPIYQVDAPDYRGVPPSALND